MHNVKISVGITAYKNSKYLIEALNSLINQSTEDWECIFVLDKGADKKTQKIFKKFDHPKFIKHECETHKGAEQARHEAIKLSSSDWFFQLDSDDKIPQNALKEIIKKINENPKAEFICGLTNHFSKNNSYVMPPSNDPEILTASAPFSSQMPIKNFNVLSLRRICKRIKIFCRRLGFLVVSLRKKIVGAETDKILYHRRNHDNNVISRNISKWPEVIDIIIHRHPKYFCNNERRRKALYSVYEKLARHYRRIRKRKKAATFAKIALENGESTTTLEEILKENNMSNFRYALRLLGKFF